MRKLFLTVIIIALFLTVNSCRDESKYTVHFSYKAILDKEFKFGLGKVVPITIEKSIETDGDISSSGLYYYFSSNREGGNFDIYLRYLADITSVRITNHPSRDYSPAISPDGEYLAFVSNREDPEGDVYIVELDAENLIDKAKSSVSGIPTLDDKAVNLTQFQDPVTKTVMLIKDSSPSWSSDGEWITYSSAKDNLANIWIMDKEGEEKRKITSKGGMYPKYSPDGKKIIFISYRDKGSNGDIYIVDVKSGVEKRITSTKGIEHYPTFMKNSNKIIYSIIDRDTNGDRKITLKDNSVIIRKNLLTGMEYPLTLYSSNSFNAKWYSAIKKTAKLKFKSRENRGVIVFSNQVGTNINTNIIPDTGIIPQKYNAKLQFELASRYMTEYNDKERYHEALERVYNFFAKKRDNISQIYTAKALTKLSIDFKRLRKKSKSKEMVRLLKDFSKKGNAYTKIKYSYLKSKLKGKKSVKLFVNGLRKIKRDKKLKIFIPYVMEDLADEYIRTNQRAKARKIFISIVKKHKKYRRLLFVQNKLALFYVKKIGKDLPESAQYVLNKGIGYKLVTIKKTIIKIFNKEKNYKRKLQICFNLKKKYKKNRKILPLIQFLQSQTLYKMKNDKGAIKNILSYVNKIRKTDYIYYRTNLLLGDIYLKNKKTRVAEKNISAAALRYRLVFQDINYKKRIQWLIDFYEDYGQRAEISGKYKTATNLYHQYTKLMGLIHRRKRYEKIYNEFGSRAHVLYIDAYIERYGEKKIDALITEYQKELQNARVNFDKAFIYGLAYIYTKKGLIVDKKLIASSEETIGLYGMLENFSLASEQIEWAIFLDDTFIDPFILKSWIYQYIDMKRGQYTGYKLYKIGKYFPKYLWEKNIAILEKSLTANDEGKYRENEGNLHLNLANTYFLLSNYPRALKHYELTKKYKRKFGSNIEEALYYYHFGYCYWQNSDLEKAKNEIAKALNIYEGLGAGKNRWRYKSQLYLLYKYNALFYRSSKDYVKAIEWYNKILDFTNEYKVKIDRARYLQEIAYCYKMMGSYDKAISYLNNAHGLLKNKKEEKKKYKLSWSIFEIFTFPFYDLGPDTAVIGDSKIYKPLDIRNKKLLNFSMMEDISIDTGNFNKAIKYLKKKIEIIKLSDNSIDKESRMKALNNLGYYSFRIRKYKNAIKYFTEAWTYASSEDVNNLSGTFMSIMNLSNLYAFLIESDSSVLKNPIVQVENLVKKITAYRNNYEKNRFEKDKEALEEKAEAEKKKVTQKELNELKKIIAEDAIKIYYKIDISLGVLEFYKAELNFNRIYPVEENSITSAYDLYKNNRNIYNQYANALKRFNNALSIAEKEDSNKALIVKLKMNAGSCHAKMKNFDMAYAQFLDAKNISESMGLHQLKLNAYFLLGRFLRNNGKSVEGKEYLATSLNYFKKASEMIEEFPLLYSSQLNKIKSIYNNYILTLIKVNAWKRAFFVSERKYDVVKNILINLSSPEFSERDDSLVYKKYLIKINIIKTVKDKISSLLLSGNSLESESVKEKIKKYNIEKDNLNELIRKIHASDSKIKDYVSINNNNIVATNSSVIYKLYKYDNSLLLWKIFNGEITVKKIKITDDLSYINDLEKILGEKRNLKQYIVLNNTFKDLFIDKDLKDKKLKSSYMMIPVVNKFGDYRNAKSKFIRNIILTVKKGDSGKDEGKNRVDYTEYSVIGDGKDTQRINSHYLFKNRIEPVVLFKEMANVSLDSYYLFIEAALYSGIKNIYFSKNISKEFIDTSINVINEKGFSYLQPGLTANNNIFGIGYNGGKKSDRENSLKQTWIEEYQLFLYSMNYRNFVEAKIHLNKWKFLYNGDEKTKNEVSYLISLAQLKLLEGKDGEALTSIDRAISLSDRESLHYKKSVMLKIYILIEMGNVTGASLLISQNNMEIKDFADVKIFNLIIELSKMSSDSPVKEFLSIINDENSKYILGADRLIFLFSEYLYLFGNNSDSVKVLSLLKSNKNLSARGNLKYFLISHNKFKGKYSSRENKISDFMKKKTYIKTNKNLAFNLISNDNSSDSLSYFAFISMIRQFEKSDNLKLALPFIESINIKEIGDNSSWKDAISLYLISARTYYINDDFNMSLKMFNYAISIAEDQKISSLLANLLYKKSIILLKKKNYTKAYDVALRCNSLISKDSSNYNRFQILLLENEFYADKLDDAMARIASLNEEALKDVDALIVKFLAIKFDLLRISKSSKPTIEDADNFNKKFKDTLLTIDNNPKVLKKFGRLDLINDICDEYIRFKMKTGKQSDALVFVEVKKHLTAKIKFSNEDMIIKPFYNFPLEKLRAKISDKSILMYFAKNRDDIYVWMLGKKIKKTKILSNSYKKVLKSIDKYRELSSKFKNTQVVSRELSNIFYPLKKYYKNKKVIIIATDSDLESVPFEIIGQKNMLEESHSILYLSSIVSGLKKLSGINREVNILSSDNSKIYNYVEKVAIEESGIKYNIIENISSGIGHVHRNISYNKRTRRLYINKKLYSSHILNADYLYIPSIDFKNISNNDFLIFNSSKGIGGVIMNDSEVHDVNNAIFVDNFYKFINKGNSLIKSFEKAKFILRKSSNYKHPAYWAGIRLYLNGL